MNECNDEKGRVLINGFMGITSIERNMDPMITFIKRSYVIEKYRCYSFRVTI